MRKRRVLKPYLTEGKARETQRNIRKAVLRWFVGLLIGEQRGKLAPARSKATKTLTIKNYEGNNIDKPFQTDLCLILLNATENFY